MWFTYLNYTRFNLLTSILTQDDIIQRDAICLRFYISLTIFINLFLCIYTKERVDLSMHPCILPILQLQYLPTNTIENFISSVLQSFEESHFRIIYLPRFPLYTCIFRQSDLYYVKLAFFPRLSWPSKTFIISIESSFGIISVNRNIDLITRIRLLSRIEVVHYLNLDM